MWGILRCSSTIRSWSLTRRRDRWWARSFLWLATKRWARPTASPARPTMHRTPLFGTEGLLGHRQFVPCSLGEPALGDQFALAGGHQRAHPEVNPDRSTGRRQRMGGNVGAPDAHPPPVPLARHRDGLGGAPEGAMHSKLHVSDAVQPQPLVLGVESPAVGVLPLHRFKAGSRLETGVAGRLPAATAPIEGAKGSVQALQGPSAHHYAGLEEIRSDLACLGQGRALVKVRDRSAFPGPGTSALLQGRVVELALSEQ